MRHSIGYGHTADGNIKENKLETSKKILVCPLDWGLGHATRCVPIIRRLINEGNQVVIGADKKPMAFLKMEFPELDTLIIPGYQVDYGNKGSSFKLFCEGVNFLKFIKKEKHFFDEILKKEQFDLIISDNRYGIFHKDIESIIITHQLYPKAVLGEGFMHKKIKRLLSNFTEVWIPDLDNKNNLSGDLSHLKPISNKHRFIGPLSRFSLPDQLPEIEYDVCAIVSGPEPQRSIFETTIRKQIEQHNLNAVLVRGLPTSTEAEQELVFNHLETNRLQEFILKSKWVLCRSGYSSIMDMNVLEKGALLVPTPGQTEQIYLAEYHKGKEHFIVQEQNQLDLKILF